VTGEGNASVIIKSSKRDEENKNLHHKKEREKEKEKCIRQNTERIWQK
jgi:hypothetical protein